MKNLKKIPKITIRLIVVLAAIFFIFNILISFFGKSMISWQIEKNLKRKTTLKSLKVILPLSINIQKLNIDGMASIDSFSFRPSLLSFFTGKLILNELKLTRPRITLELNREGKFNIPLQSTSKKKLPILLTGIDIKQGKIIIVYKEADSSVKETIVNNINVNIAKASFPPTSLFTRFDISAFLGEREDAKNGELVAIGWIDFGPKNMEGKIELKGIDLLYLPTYYRGFISEENFTSGKLDFISDLRAVKNDLIIKNHLELFDLEYAKEASAKGEQQIDLTPSVIDLFSEAKRIVFNLPPIYTKLDNPRIGQNELKAIIAQSMIQNIASQPPEKIKENLKDIKDKFEDIGKSFKEIFKKKEE